MAISPVPLYRNYIVGVAAAMQSDRYALLGIMVNEFFKILCSSTVYIQVIDNALHMQHIVLKYKHKM
jgi:hypothetical protein